MLDLLCHHLVYRISAYFHWCRHRLWWCYLFSVSRKWDFPLLVTFLLLSILQFKLVQTSYYSIIMLFWFLGNSLFCFYFEFCQTLFQTISLDKTEGLFFIHSNHSLLKIGNCFCKVGCCFSAVLILLDGMVWFRLVPLIWYLHFCQLSYICLILLFQVNN